MNLKILNRSNQLPADGWYNIEALGEHVNHEAKVIQVIDEKSVASILNRFAAEAEKAGEDFPGKPLDRDHLSDSLQNSTEAYGWGMQLRRSANGYDAKIDWTPIGEPLVTSKDGKPPAYKFFSTGYEPTECEKIGERKIGKRTYGVVRPLRLASISLTNQPNNLGQRPISNRNGKPADADENQNPPMKNIMTILGLAADASEESAVAAIQKITNRATTAEAEVTTLKAENKSLLEGQIETDLEKYKNRYKPEDKEKVRAKLVKNRADTVELLELASEVVIEGKTRITNRSSATPPSGERRTPAGGEPDEREVAAKITNRANELKGQNNTRSFDSCWNQAQREIYAAN